MGLIGKLGRIFRKDSSKSLTVVEAKLQTAFGMVNSDIKLIQNELGKLHSGHELTKQDLKNLSLWLGYLKKDSENAENNFEKVAAWLNYLHDQSERSKKLLENHEKEIEKLKQGVAQHVATGVATPATGVALKTGLIEPIKALQRVLATGVANVGNVGNVASATGNSLPEPLKQLLNLMISINEPVTYQAIANQIGKNKITVRVNMNRLKREGLVEEFTAPNGTKLFAVKNKERVKKMYNFQPV
jgi:archaellum component FlaC